MSEPIIAATAAQETPAAAQELTPKQLAWNAHKAAQRERRKAERTLRSLGVPRRLRGRVVRVVSWGERLSRPTPPQGARTPRGRLSNPTAIRGV